MLIIAAVFYEVPKRYYGQYSTKPKTSFLVVGAARLTNTMNVSQKLSDGMLKDLLVADVEEAKFVTTVLPDSASTSPLMIRKTSIEGGSGLRKTDLSANGSNQHSKQDEAVPSFGYERKLSVEWLNEHESINQNSLP